MDRKLRCAIVGCGGIARSHANGYTVCPETEIVALCDLLPDKAERFATEHCPGATPTIYTDYHEMFAKEELDCVSVTVWNSEHAAISIAALKAGINVLCEKPMAMTAADAEEMLAVAKENGKLLQIGFVRRYENTTRHIQNLISDGFLGDVYYAKAQYLRRNGCPGGWFADKSFSGGGPLIDLGVHVIDLVRFLAGGPKPVSVYGYTFDNLGRNRAPRAIPEGGYRRDYEFGDRYDFKNDTEDFAGAIIRFDSGLVLQVEASFNLNLKSPVGQVDLFGTKSALQLTDHIELFGVVNDYYMNMTPQELPKNDFKTMFEKEIAHFADCVKNGTECIAPAEDGVTLMKILDAVYESAKIGHEVIL
ncbi:MAG: Gfo/Idh/MocA family oxidoreductase [Clostridia bacterium]|nr:Gfo/Idh/MocA family oxidoreductase [Clostridia bacterium]